MPDPLAKCPNSETLAAYVSGSLAEGDAEWMHSHLQGCSRCLEMTDELSEMADTLVSAMRRPLQVAGEKPASSSPPADWIAAAQQPRTRRPGRSDESGGGANQESFEPVSLEDFLQILPQSGLCDEADVSQWSGGDWTDAQALARHLVAERRLTRFQARALLRGRWKGLVLDSYVVLEKIGQGGMGQVYRAEHRVLGREVCLKVLRADGRRSRMHIERFRREAQTVAALDHPNIVTAHDANVAGGIPYLAMEYIRGSDLNRWVAENGPMNPERAVSVTLQSAEALEHAHQHGVVHRDIKPHNLMLDSGGTVKILDMGLARFELATQDGSAFTKSGTVMGTVEYMAPEQAMNARTADARADIYALGCTLFFLLTGRPPYVGETLVETLVAHRESPVPDLTRLRQDVTPPLNAIFRRCLAKHPDARYASMRDLVDDLVALQHGRPVAAVGDQVAPVPQQPLQATPLPVTGPDGNRVTTAPSTTNHAPAEWTMSTPPAATTLAVGAGQVETVHNVPAGVAGLAGLPPADWTEPLPGPLEPAPNLPPTAATHRIGRRPSAAMIRWGLAGVAGVIVSVGVIAAIATLLAPLAGPGPALVAVAPHGFSDPHFQKITGWLDARGIPYQVASTTAGYAKSKYGKKVAVDVTLDQARPGAYRAIVLCGGNSHKFKGHSFIGASVERGRALVATGESWCVLAPVWAKAGKKEFDETRPGFEVGRVSRGYVVKICDDEAVENVLEHVVTNLAK